MEDLLSERPAWKRKRQAAYERVRQALAASDVVEAGRAMDRLVEVERDYDAWMERYLNRILNAALAWVEGAVFQVKEQRELPV